MATDPQFANIDDNVPLAFGLVIAAGLSTAVGASAVYFNRIVTLASQPVLAAGLGFSGGVMLYVSFVEIFVKSQIAFTEHGHEESDATAFATLCFFAGVVVMKLLGVLVHMLDGDHACHHDLPCGGPSIVHGTAESQDVDPTGVVLEQKAEAGCCQDVSCRGDTAKAENTPVDVDAVTPATAPGLTNKDNSTAKDPELKRMGLNTALAIGIHNFPEGLATFVATLADPIVGVTLAVAIAIHNIPEGLCVALPVYYASGNRHAGFLWALLSGLSEPVGALIGYAIIKSTGEDMNQLVYGVLFGMVAGMMVAIVIFELMPTAQRYDPQGKYVGNMTIVGMLVMAASLIMFGL